MFKRFTVSILMLFIYSSLLVNASVINGKVIDKTGKQAIENVKVVLIEKKLAVITDNEGNFKFENIQPGVYSFALSGSEFLTQKIENISIKKETENIVLEVNTKEYQFGDIVVFGAGKKIEKITESPASVIVKTQQDIEKSSRTGKIASALEGAAGVDILQSGATDFIVNARGFSNGLNRRILVLQDGRDVAMPLLGAEEWNSFSVPADEFSRMELVKGPSAALYGGNAFNGVLNLTTYAPKEVLGTKVSLLGGDYETYKADVRHAGLWGKLGYKINVGYSHNLNYANRRDSAKYLEYSGLPIEKKVLTNDNRQTFSGYGSMRVDYDFNATQRLVSEFGFSRSGNETYVFGLGRTLVKDVSRPYFRLEYNSQNINIHGHYMQRSVNDSMWLMVPNAPLLDNSKDILIDAQHNFDLFGNLNIIWGLSEELQYIRTSGTSIPNDVDGQFTSGYAQLEWKATSQFKLVGSGRVDYSNVHNTQFSPRASFVFNPVPEHQFRLTFSKAFQRPNYSELYRLTPDAPAMSAATKRPVDFAALNKAINDTLTALTGSQQNVNLNLNAMNAKSVGNPNLKVEQILGAEIGYKGVISNDLYITIDVYYNQMNDFITNFLPAVNKDIPAWSPDLSGNLAQYNDMVKNMVYNSLSARDRLRLSSLNGVPTFVVSNANVGKVEQYGVDFEIGYNFTKNLSIAANYSYYGFSVLKSDAYQPLLPNTSPHKFNLSATYSESKSYDATLSFRYSEGFDWLAGTFNGYVPAYAIMNFNGGAYVTKNLYFGVNVFNLLDRKHYEVFGGTYLPRYTTAKITYEF